MTRVNRSSRDSMVQRQDGMALLVTLMVMMLVSALMVGFVTAIIADQRASGLDRDQTQAYAAAHAGLEQLTSDLSQLFTRDFSPSATQISALRTNPPGLQGFGFCAPEDTDCQPNDVSGYMVAPTFVDGLGNPRPEDPVNGSAITAGPYQGFRGIITPYDITVTARSRTGGGAEVRMRRTLQTVAVPVFQFGMFSETDLAFHAGEPFAFAGRIHTNGNLFLAHTGSTAASCTSTDATLNRLRIMDRITAVGEVIRSHLPNGLITTDGYNGATCVPTLIASNPVNNQYRNLLRTEGSKITDLASADNEPLWTQRSTGTYASNIRNSRTGARALNLPLVADLDDNGAPDAQPIDLIRRPATANEDTHPTQRFVFAQRYFSQASLRILLSDTAAEIQNLPTVTQATQPVRLNHNIGVDPDERLDYAPLPAPLWRPPLGNYEEPNGTWGPAGFPAGNLPAFVYRGAHNESVLGGFIKIEMQRQNGTWQDVTGEILGLGIAGRNLADSNEPFATRWNNLPDSTADTCPEPNPNAVIRLQRLRDIPMDMTPCGVTVAAGIVTAISQNEHDYWPLTLYDPREGHFRDGLADTTSNLALGGIMHYVELDVNNLRRWLLGQIGANGTNAKNENGFIVYFSDRRNNKNAAGQETGEYGWEDIANPGSAAGTPNGRAAPGRRGPERQRGARPVRQPAAESAVRCSGAARQQRPCDHVADQREPRTSGEPSEPEGENTRRSRQPRDLLPSCAEDRQRRNLHDDTARGQLHPGALQQHHRARAHGGGGKPRVPAGQLQRHGGEHDGRAERRRSDHRGLGYAAVEQLERHPFVPLPGRLDSTAAPARPATGSRSSPGRAWRLRRDSRPTPALDPTAARTTSSEISRSGTTGPSSGIVARS